MRSRAPAVLFAVALAAIATSTRADDDDRASLLQAANDALAGERPNDAIAKLEALGDRGVVDPVVSYDRGLAYAARVRARGERPGDLGRAAHGFEEARQLSHDRALVEDATRALSAVRGEIARRRARAGDPVELEHGISLGRSFVELLSENGWAILAALASAALTAGMIVFARSTERRARVAGATTGAIAGALLAASMLSLHYARGNRFHLREGVVIATSRLLDARRIAKDGVAPVPEGARVRLLDEDSGLAHVEIGRAEGWLPGAAVLPLAKH